MRILWKSLTRTGFSENVEITLLRTSSEHMCQLW